MRTGDERGGGPKVGGGLPNKTGDGGEGDFSEMGKIKEKEKALEKKEKELEEQKNKLKEREETRERTEEERTKIVGGKKGSR